MNKQISIIVLFLSVILTSCADRLAWKFVREEDTIHIYKKFINSFPESKYAPVAKQRIEKKRERIIEDAERARIASINWLQNKDKNIEDLMIVFKHLANIYASKDIIKKYLSEPDNKNGAIWEYHPDNDGSTFKMIGFKLLYPDDPNDYGSNLKITGFVYFDPNGGVKKAFIMYFNEPDGAYFINGYSQDNSFHESSRGPLKFSNINSYDHPVE